MVREEGLEPSRGYPLEPKSSASTNSATLALGRAKHTSIPQQMRPSSVQDNKAREWPREAQPPGPRQQLAVLSAPSRGQRQQLAVLSAPPPFVAPRSWASVNVKRAQSVSVACGPPATGTATAVNPVAKSADSMVRV